MSVIQESVNLALCHANPWSLPVSVKNFLYFCNKYAILAAILSAFLFYFFIWLQANCLQLDSIFIANNIRKKMNLRHFNISHNVSLIIGLYVGRHLGNIEMLNDARMASLGFYKDNVCTTRIDKKKFKIKFQILLKFAQIPPD